MMIHENAVEKGLTQAAGEKNSATFSVLVVAYSQAIQVADPTSLAGSTLFTKGTEIE